MLPAATEIVGALGLMDQLLAVSHECDYPQEANHRPRVTFCEIYGKGLPSADIDRWVSERLRSGGSLYTLDEPKLRELALEPKKLQDILACVTDVAEAMGHPEKAGEVCRRLEQRIEVVRTKVAGLRRPTVFIMEW